MRTIQAIAIVMMMSLALFVPGIAHAFSMDLYETLENTPSGTACDICSVLQLPDQTYGGYVVLLDSGGVITDPTTWSDVVVFGTNVSNGILSGIVDSQDDFGATMVQLLSKGCASGISTDVSCFPTYAQLTAALYDSLFETPPVTEYDASPNEYYIHSTEAATVPEPSSLLLLGSGLTALGLWRRSKVKS